MAEKGAERGRDGSIVAKRSGGEQTATVPLSMSPISVAAASPLRPVRSTLVAPILPEPMARMSGAAGEPRQQDAERDRAAQIAEDEGCRVGERRRPVERL